MLAHRRLVVAFHALDVVERELLPVAGGHVDVGVGARVEFGFADVGLKTRVLDRLLHQFVVQLKELVLARGIHHVGELALLRHQVDLTVVQEHHDLLGPRTFAKSHGLRGLQQARRPCKDGRGQQQQKQACPASKASETGLKHHDLHDNAPLGRPPRWVAGRPTEFSLSTSFAPLL